MSEWKPMAEHTFPWEPHEVLVAAYDQDRRGVVEVFRCYCADAGHYYPLGDILALDETGWVAFAWRPDDTPSPDDAKFPPWVSWLELQKDLT